MNATFIRSHLSALALAATLILAACGGGDATPPAESVPPTVNISSSVISGAAAGPVTFTFNFSEDVGSSFTADSVSASNGTKGTFTKVSATQYTLVVTPAPNSSGNVGVTIGANVVADVVGNKMPVAAAMTQAFDTRPPTVAVTNNSTGGVAKAAVTFTFNFSKDVGTSFTADDVVVSGGGTKGAFARVSATQYTLVVTPTANSSGTLGVSIAAGAFSDAGGTGSQAASTISLPFDTVPKTQMALPVTFDSATVDYGFIGFGGAEDSSVATDPADAANKVAKVVRAAGSETFAGTTITGAAQLGFSPKVPFSTSDTRISVRVRSPDAGIPVRLKLEDHTDANKSVEVEVLVTQANAWQTLTFNFAPGNQAAGTAAINFGFNYTKATIFFDFGRAKAQSVQKTYYFDDITFVPGTPGGGGGGGGGGTSSALINFDESPAPTLTDFGVNGEAPAIVADPAGGTNKVLRFRKFTGSEQWAGVTVSTGANNSIAKIPFSATAKTMTLRVYSPAVGVRVRLKVEDAGNPGISVETDAISTMANAWETLTFNFANPATNPPVGGGATSPLDLTKNYTKASIFFDFGLGNGGVGPLPANRVYYADDLTFVGASSGGGGTGGGGTSSAVVNFDESPAPALSDFGVNGEAPAIVADPAGGTNKVLRFRKFTGSEQWAGVTVSTGANNSIPKLPFTAANKTMTLRVYSPAVGVRVRLKVEDAGNPGISVETDAISTMANAWETLTFNFANPGTNPPVGGGATSPLDLTKNYTKASIFFDFGLGNGGVGPLPANRVYYADDLRFVSGS